MIAKLAEFSLDRARMSMTIILVAMVLSIFGLLRLGFTDGHESVFSSDTPEYSNYLDFTKQYSDTNTNVAILISSPKPFTKNDLAEYHNFLLDTHLVEGANAVFSLFSLIRIDEKTGDYTPLFSDFENAPSLAALFTEAKQSSLSGLQLLSEELNETVAILSFEPNMTDLNFAIGGLKELSELTAKFSSKTSMEAKITGLLPIRNRVVEQIKIDQPIINGLGAIAGFLVSLYIFRSFWIALLNGIASVFALFLSLGLIGIFGFSINVVNTALPVLVLVLASSDCTHITFEFCRQSGSGINPRTAIRRAMLEMTGPCILTSLTTAFAFATLYFSSSPIIHELSITGALSVIAALGAVVLIHPLVFILASRFKVVRHALARPLRAKRSDTARLQFFNRLLERRNFIVTSAVLVCISLCLLIFPIKTSYSFLENINTADPLIKVMKKVEKFSGPMTALEIPIKAKDGVEKITEQQIKEMAEIHLAVESVMPNYSITSLYTIIQFLQSQGKSVSSENIIELLDFLPDQYLHRVINKSGTGFLVSVMVPDLGSEKLREIVHTIDAALTGIKTEHLVVGATTGMLSLSSALSDKMIKQLMISFMIAAVMCPVFIGLWYKNLKFTLFAIIPNTLPILIVGAWIMASGTNLQFTSVLAMTIAFGIAVDDTIHTLNRLALYMETNNGQLTIPMIAKSMSYLSPALFTTTVILSSGLITVLWSEMPMIEYFGLLCIATFVFAFIADIIVLPAIVAVVTSFSGVNSRTTL